MRLTIPTFKTDKELHRYLIDNEQELAAKKMASVKHADGFGGQVLDLTKSTKSKGGYSIKANDPVQDLETRSFLDTRVIINTTNLLDGHRDVHIDGIWDDALAKMADQIMHVQEHQSHRFDRIIADGSDLKAYADKRTWKELGFNYNGTTEALTFDSRVRKDRNEFMFNQYGKGFVRQHSVGMWYNLFAMCINDKDYPEAFENWEQYYDVIANKEDMEGVSYFWAILKATPFEGSAVPRGSNWVSPTEENDMKAIVEPSKQEPDRTKELDAINRLLTKMQS